MRSCGNSVLERFDGLAPFVVNVIPKIPPLEVSDQSNAELINSDGSMFIFVDEWVDVSCYYIRRLITAKWELAQLWWYSL